LKKYRRIEVNAFRRRVTIISGAWPRNAFEVPGQTNDEVSLDDSEASEPVEADSPEGQLILLEAVRSLERRLSPETRAAIRDSPAVADAQAEESTLTLRKGYDHEKIHLVREQED
jgi:hypothetical protein